MTHSQFPASSGCSQTTSAVRKPDVFIVGAPKCGTSAMADYLAAHPEIYMARKEMHLFGSDLRFSPRFYRRNLEEYLSEYATRNGELRAGEASVWYLYSKRAASELKAFNPDARIVILLRDPVEVLHSLYFQFCFDGNEQLGTFEEALAAEADRRNGHRIPRLAYFPKGLLYREVVRFEEQVRRFLEVFEREQLHIVIYDDFCGDPAGTFRRTLNFLGVRDDMGPAQFQVVNGTKAVRSRLLRAVLGDPTLRRAAASVRRAVPARWRGMLERIDRRLWDSNTRGASRPEISAELGSRLRLELAPEVERLSELLGRDLTHWSRARSRVRPFNPVSIPAAVHASVATAVADLRRT